ncbi:MAG: aspartate racemase [Acidobacteriota bacterium]|jgi:aspartate racemase|nr:aspartate racemase [Acidobacteriota bacterium]
MKTLGIIGGLGPESTVVYYRSIISGFRERSQAGNYPQIIVNSIDLSRFLELMAANDYAGVTEFLVAEVKKLAAAGASFGIIAANTPHVVFDDVQRESPIELLSIVAATCNAAKRQRLKRVGLFGTRYTMQGKFYAHVFSKEGIELLLPGESEQVFIDAKYFDELVKGMVLVETRQRLLAIVERMQNVERIDGLILGGTELSLILGNEKAGRIPILDTTSLHVEAVLAHMLPQERK